MCGVYTHPSGDNPQSGEHAILQLKIKVLIGINLRVVCIEVIAYRNEYITKIWTGFQMKNEILDKARVSSRFLYC